MQLLTIPEAAAQLRVDRRTVYRLLSERKIPKVIGLGAWRYYDPAGQG